jgi:hypothetical protein
VLFEFDDIKVIQSGSSRSVSGMQGFVDPDEAVGSDISASAARKAAIEKDLNKFTAIFAQGDLPDPDQQTLAKEVFNLLDSTYGVTPMEEEDLEILCTLLLNRNNRTSFESRCLLIMQWQTVGRISECFALRWKNVSFAKSSNSRSMVIHLARPKTGLEQVI